MTAFDTEKIRGISSFDRLLGTQVEAVSPGRAVVSLVVDQKHCNPMGSLHGGVLLTLADSAAGLACSWEGMSPTVEGKLSFLAPCIVGDRVWVEGKELHHGRTLRSCEVRAWNQHDKLVAAGLFTYVAPRQPSASDN